jgi:aspartate kinase
MADPKIICNPKPVKEITYRELRELSYMGAKVLHEEAVFPARELNIPIKVLNTNEPDNSGTIIRHERDYSNTPVAGIAGRDKFSLINIEKALMNWEVGFGRRVLEIIESYGISYEHSPTGIDSMSVIIRDEELSAAGEAIKEEIRRKLEPDRIEISNGLALIAIVGHGISQHPSITARIFNALAEEDIKINIICHGAPGINLIVGVREKDFKKAVKAIYDALVE